ncbi:MAG: hypothetical protein U0271_26350 [Polyangiaceae bacterium]
MARIFGLSAWIIGGSVILSTSLASAPSLASDVSSAQPLDSKADASVTLTKHYPKVGDVETTKKVGVTKLKGDVTNGKEKKTVEIERTEGKEKIEECLKVVDKECVKVKVTYKTLTQREIVAGKTNERALASQGKTYVVERNGNKPTITLEDGSKPSDAEIEQVKKDYDEEPSTKKLLDALPSSVKVGDSLDNFAKALAAHDLTSSSDDRPSKVDYTIKVKGFGEVDGKKTIILDVKGTMEGDSPKSGHLKASVAGSIELFADGAAPARGDFSGPISATLPNGAGQLDGTLAQKAASTYKW